MLYRALVLRMDDALPFEAKLLMEDFRLAVNRAVRAGLQARATSRHAIVKLLYKVFRQDHPGMSL
jgi:hypothetical protein